MQISLQIKKCYWSLFSECDMKTHQLLYDKMGWWPDLENTTGKLRQSLSAGKLLSGQSSPEKGTLNPGLHEDAPFSIYSLPFLPSCGPLPVSELARTIFLRVKKKEES
jgi:hypothetical protein